MTTHRRLRILCTSFPARPARVPLCGGTAAGRAQGGRAGSGRPPRWTQLQHRGQGPRTTGVQRGKPASIRRCPATVTARPRVSSQVTRPGHTTEILRAKGVGAHVNRFAVTHPHAVRHVGARDWPFRPTTLRSLSR